MAYFIRIDAETEVAYELIASRSRCLPQENRSQERSLIKLPKITLLTCKASPGA